MNWIMVYVIYRIFRRGSSYPQPQSPAPTHAAVAVVGTLMVLGWGALAIFFMWCGPIWAAIPPAVATMFTAVLTLATLDGK